MPATESQVFDALQERYGVGDWEEGKDVPWHEWKRKELIKIKAMRLKRRVSCDELLLAIRYCGARDIDIRAHYLLYEHISAAKRWEKDRLEMRSTRGLQASIEQAIQHEMENDPEGPWLYRFLRAAGDGRQEVYDEWLAR